MKFDRRELVYFSPVQQALNREVTNHSALMEILRTQAHADFEVRLAEIAKYAGVMLDGEYNGKDIDNICGLCLEELQKRSMQIIRPFFD